MVITELSEHVEHFRARVLQDAVSEATSSYWRQRAAAFEAAAHRPGIDWPGRATDELVAAQQARCVTAALACGYAAQLALDTHDHGCSCSGTTDPVALEEAYAIWTTTPI